MSMKKYFITAFKGVKTDHAVPSCKEHTLYIKRSKKSKTKYLKTKKYKKLIF